MPFVSIIIPVYNSERYLNITINSLFSNDKKITWYFFLSLHETI